MLLHATAARMAHFAKEAARLKAQGWRMATVNDWEQVLEFARQFSRQLWGQK